MQSSPPPPPTRAEAVVEHMHGHEILDPYRWLEDASTPETHAWIEEQNAYTRMILDAVPGRSAIQRRLEELLAIGTVTAPVVRSGRYFYVRREGSQNQPVLYLRDGPEGEDRVLLDPNSASSEGTTALDWWRPSWDGRLLAYGYSEHGNEWSVLRILDVDSGQHRTDRIERVRYTSIAWLPDASGFYYTRYPAPGDVPQGEENYNSRVFFHRLGSTPANDPEIPVADLEREDLPSVAISRDGRYLTVAVYKGPGRSDFYIRDLTESDSFEAVAVGYDALFSGEIADGVLYLHTNLDAPNYRLLAVDPRAPQRESWREVIPASRDGVLEYVGLVNHRLVAGYLRNASSALVVIDPSDGSRRDVSLPTLGTVTSVTGEWNAPDCFFGFQSFTTPPQAYRLDVETGESEVWAGVDAPLNTEAYVERQEWYTSRDGTRVSLFLVHRKDLSRDEPSPTLLYGYGGFNVNQTPAFSRGVYLWLEHGGIFAVANLRGGGEYGEDWHRAGRLEHKQNVFDDFISAAEYLIEQGYTDQSCLAIHGGSNGGLLVGVALTQRADLFRAVVCSVPLLDMLRYHHFLIARLWIPEYGSAENPDQFPFIYAYSPYHHVRKGERYPAVLFETAESDTRVDPLHARKMAALVQAANASEHPVLIRIETKAGHGVGKPLTKVVDEQTDRWCFLFWQLGLSVRSTSR